MKPAAPVTKVRDIFGTLLQRFNIEIIETSGGQSSRNLKYGLQPTPAET
jgi:hypothetical protein